MTRVEFLKFHEQFCAKMTEICKAKNADYAGAGGEDAFANFTRVEKMGIAKTEQGFLTRMLDKMSRLSSFVESGTLQVKDESALDTLHDLANYCILMAGYLEGKKTIKLPSVAEHLADLNVKRRVSEDRPLMVGDEVIFVEDSTHAEIFEIDMVKGEIGLTGFGYRGEDKSWFKATTFMQMIAQDKVRVL